MVREQGRLARIKEREEMAAEAKKRAEAEAAARRKRFEEEEAASKAVLADRMEKERVARIEFERKRELDREKERRCGLLPMYMGYACVHASTTCMRSAYQWVYIIGMLNFLGEQCELIAVLGHVRIVFHAATLVANCGVCLP